MIALAGMVDYILASLVVKQDALQMRINRKRPSDKGETGTFCRIDLFPYLHPLPLLFFWHSRHHSSEDLIGIVIGLLFLEWICTFLHWHGCLDPRPWRLKIPCHVLYITLCVGIPLSLLIIEIAILTNFYDATWSWCVGFVAAEKKRMLPAIRLPVILAHHPYNVSSRPVRLCHALDMRDFCSTNNTIVKELAQPLDRITRPFVVSRTHCKAKNENKHPLLRKCLLRYTQLLLNCHSNTRDKTRMPPWEWRTCAW